MEGKNSVANPSKQACVEGAPKTRQYETGLFALLWSVLNFWRDSAKSPERNEREK